MSKYEKAKFLVKRKARKVHFCNICGKNINPKDEYYSETLGLIDRGPHIQFYSYCLECGPKSGLEIKG
jgi:hypothetical protein